MLRSLFVLLILIPGIAAAVRSRYAALLLYLWFALFRPQEWLWIDITGLRLSLLLSLLVVVPWTWLISQWVSAEKRREYAREALPNLTHPMSIGMTLFFVTALVAHQHAFNSALSLNWIDFMWRLLLVTMVMMTLVSTKERFWGVVFVIAASIGFHATKAGISSLIGGGVRYQMGLGGAFEDSNAYALVIVTIMPFLVVIGQTTARRWLRWLCWGSVIPSAYTVVSTFSRAGFLALAIAVLAFAAMQRRRILIFLGMVVLGGVIALVVPVPEGYFDRLQTIQTYQEIDEGSALSRLHFWRVALVMVEANPFGVGLRNYDEAYDTYDFSFGKYGHKRAVHNSHFQVLAENGWAGLAIWLALFAYAFYLCLRVRSRSKTPTLPENDRDFFFAMSNGLLVSMLAFLTGGSFIATALNDLTWLTFGLAAILDRLMTEHLAASRPVAAPAAVPFQGGYRARLSAPPEPDGSGPGGGAR